MDGKISITKSQYLNRASAFFPAYYIRPHICGNRSKDFCGICEVQNFSILFRNKESSERNINYKITEKE
jgi:hypothetical protein